WYFHLKALGNSFSPPVLHWKVNIDITPPEFEYLRFKEGDSTTDRTPTLEFEAVDLMSGVDYFEYKLSKGDFKTIESPYKVEKLEPGLKTAEVQVYDKAGNSNLGKTRIEIIALEAPRITKLTRRLYLFQNAKIWGTGPVNSKIILFVISENNKNEFEWETVTNSDGNWHYTHPDYLQPGKYEVYALAYDEADGESEKSNTESFLVSISGISLFGIAIPIWIIIIAVVLLLILLKFLIPYILILFPTERSRIIVVALIRQGELLLLEKNRELSTDELVLEFPFGKLKAGETPEKAARRIIKEHFIGLNINKSIKKFNFDLEDKKKPISLIICEHDIANPEVNKQTGYSTHRWINIAEDTQKYFANISDGFQKQSFIELQKYLNKEKTGD
ncbi:MAG: NUDIX domain-containing protein, partial [bacterium]